MTVYQREKRVGLQLPVKVQGEDAAGIPFDEATHSVNVSGGGICFESQHQVEIGTRLQLEIELPLPLRRHFGNRAVYQAQAVVCRVERPPGEAVGRVSARFLGERRP
jgi:hypothetical protein